MARILVADDEPPMRQVIRHACERAGHEVHEAINAPSTVETYRRIKPDLLILDVGMPGGGAQVVLTTLRFGGAQKMGPVLVVTGSMAGSADEVRAALQVDRVVLKPFRVTELMRAVADLLPKADRPPAPPPA